MKKNALNAALAASLVAATGVAGNTKAVELNADGTGQVLIFPYYTVNRNQQTIISVVNATNVAKAVRVRFLEGYNSREVLDFKLFLSGFDVWAGTVFALTDAGLTGDGAALLTVDRSCTLPPKSEWTGSIGGRPYQEFLQYAYSGNQQDSGPTGITRTREGHVELLHMADLSGALRAGVTHLAGVPANCNAITSIDTTSSLLLPPSGGLFGAGGIVNVAQGTFYTYNADAIAGFSKVSLFPDNALPLPTLAQANTGPEDATAYVFNAAGELLRSDYPRSGQPSRAIDAVSAVFMASSLLNEYNADSGVGSSTDWVVTFPTKRFYVDNQILGVPLGSPGALPPFTFTFGQQSIHNGDAKSCSQVQFLPFDREEGRLFILADGLRTSPPITIPSLCTSVNVINLLSRTAPPGEPGVLGSQLTTQVSNYAVTGWMRLDLNPLSQPHALRASRDGDVYGGLPATGFQAVNYINAHHSPGVLANYSGAFRHRVLRTCENATSGTCS